MTTRPKTEHVVAAQRKTKQLSDHKTLDDVRLDRLEKLLDERTKDFNRKDKKLAKLRLQLAEASSRVEILKSKIRDATDDADDSLDYLNRVRGAIDLIKGGTDDV